MQVSFLTVAVVTGAVKGLAELLREAPMLSS
jgi:hypothetical protein